MITKSTQNLLNRWKARSVLLERGITQHNTPDYFDLVTQEAKKYNFENGTKEQIIADLEDGDTVRIDVSYER